MKWHDRSCIHIICMVRMNVSFPQSQILSREERLAELTGIIDSIESNRKKYSYNQDGLCLFKQLLSRISTKSMRFTELAFH